MTSRGMRARILPGLALAAACACASRPCVADPSDTDSSRTAPPPWPADVSVNGFLSTSYSYNFNEPPSGTNRFRVFDFDDRTFKVDVFELVVQKKVAKPREAGFRVDVT